MPCVCGKDFTFPALLVGFSEQKIPVVLFHCGGCGKSSYAPLNLPKPFVAEKSEKPVSSRGEYVITPPENRVFLNCPLCGNVIGLWKSTHTIADDGKVTPTVACLNGCGFHAQVVLKDWRK